MRRAWRQNVILRTHSAEGFSMTPGFAFFVGTLVGLAAAYLGLFLGR